MRINWGLFKVLTVIVLAAILFGFAKRRNEARNLSELKLEFTDDRAPFITVDAVNKLLIQNNDSVTSITKDKLVLKEMESRLTENPMVREAQVFVSIDGKLGAEIEQRDPIARVASQPDFYIDSDGEKMPLSRVHAARVPLVTGAFEGQMENLTALLLAIRADAFMNKSVVGIHCRKDGLLVLKVRKYDLEVVFGKPIDWERKFRNFKAFFQKSIEDNTLKDYRMVNLRFGDQVVATNK